MRKEVVQHKGETIEAVSDCVDHVEKATEPEVFDPTPVKAVETMIPRKWTTAHGVMQHQAARKETWYGPDHKHTWITSETLHEEASCGDCQKEDERQVVHHVHISNNKDDGKYRLCSGHKSAHTQLDVTTALRPPPLEGNTIYSNPEEKRWH